MKAYVNVPLARAALVALSAITVASSVPLSGASAQGTPQSAVIRFSMEELENLVAPIALYPDPILAQVLVAATFADQIEFAARHVRANGTKNIDDQSWDVSVKAVAHYAPVLNMLAEREDWTTALGQAYAVQSGDVMTAVQNLREMARAQGNLVSTPQQEVVVQDRNIVIVPAQPTVIYVPTYDPTIIYYRPVHIVGPYAGYWSWGMAFPIGVWLNYDCDWYGRGVYYDGWRGGGWRARSRPYIHISFVYVQPRYHVVHINRTIIHRTVIYDNLRRYNTVHRGVTFADRGRQGPGRFTDDRIGDGGRRDNGDLQGRDDRGPQGRNDRAQPGRDDRGPVGGDDSRGPVGRDDSRGPVGRDDTRGRPGDANRGTTRDEPALVPMRPSTIEMPRTIERRGEKAPVTAPTRRVPPQQSNGAYEVQRAPVYTPAPQRTAPPVQRQVTKPNTGGSRMQQMPVTRSPDTRSAPQVSRPSAPTSRSAPQISRPSAPAQRSAPASRGKRTG